MDALAPFTVPNEKQEPEPLPYLKHDDQFNFDIKLTAAIAAPGKTPYVVSKTNFKHMSVVSPSALLPRLFVAMNYWCLYSRCRRFQPGWGLF
jgi:hypothetical protein